MPESSFRKQGRRARLLASAVVTTLVCGGVAGGGLMPAWGADLVPVPKSEYRLSAVSSESDPYPAAPSLDGTALGAFDGDFSTQWTSRYSENAPFPHWIVVDLQRSISVAALDYSVKKGQQVAAKDVAVYVTDDPEVAASGSTEPDAWGEPAATATLTAPSASDERQRVELDAAVTGRYVMFEIITAQGTAGGGIGELEVFSDSELPPVPGPEEPTDPEVPAGEVFEISNGTTTAQVSQAFPTIAGYRVGDAALGGQSGDSEWVVNGTAYAATTTANAAASDVEYVSVLDGVDVTVTSTIRVADDGTVRFEVTDVAGSTIVNTLGLSENVFLSANTADGTVALDRTQADPDSTRNADEHIVVTSSTASAAKNAGYAFLGNGSLVGSVITNATTQESGGEASWNTRLTTAVSSAGASIGSNTWLIHPTAAADERVTQYELPSVTVMLTADRNDDDAVDWQDAGILYRDVAGQRYGGDRVADRVVSRIPFNFASSTTNYFDLVLDNTKRIANQTDGLGQWVLNKGFGNEGHDSANTDYGGNYNERAGGLDDLNGLVEEGKSLNADMSVHVNATEIYPQANSFDSEILKGDAPYGPGWNWLDQSFYIDQQKDLGQGRVLDRFQQLRDEVPGLSGVYIDVYYSNGWVAEELADELNGMGLEVATEWGDKFVDNAVWAHWPNDLAYGGATNKGVNSTMVRFMQNSDADIWNADALLGQQILVDAEGWAGNGNWDGFIGNVWETSLPTKFVQHFDLMTYEEDVAASLTDGVEISVDDGVRTISVDGATVLQGDSYLLPWQSLESSEDTGSPLDADKMYFFTASGGEKTFDLTAAFDGATDFNVFALTDQGRQKTGTVSASDGSVTLTGEAGVAYVVEPTTASARAAIEYRDAGLADPGFNSGSLDVWNPTGDVSLARTSAGDEKADPTGDNIAVMGAGEASVSQKVTGLAPGEKYSFSAQVEIAHTGTRDVTIAVDNGEGIAQNSWNLSPSYNYMRADSKSGLYYQRGSVSFTAPESGEVTVSITSADGDAAVSIDNARIMDDTTSQTVEGTVYSNDFEGNQPGWGPFVKGDASGIDDPRTSISHRHDPYTTADWRNTAAPHNPGGSTAGLAVDSVLSGDSSLMSNSENNGVVYRTDPTLLSLDPGHTYQVDFDYQVGAAGSYQWLQGVDAISDGEVTSTVTSARPFAQALETTHHTSELTVGCGDYSWVGLQRTGGTDVNFILDDFTVTDLGETPGGAACATLSGEKVSLNPGTATEFETTFTNTEGMDVDNVGVQLTVPEGYDVQVTDESSNVFAEVAEGDSVTTNWLITAPAEAAGSSIEIGIDATYVADCDVRTVRAAVYSDVAAKARIPSSQISVTASSEETSAGAGEGPAALLLDGDTSTIWHTQYNGETGEYPHILDFDLGSVETVEGVSYLRRSANVNGPIKGYSVEVSADGETYSDVASGEWADAAGWQDVVFDAVDARFVRVTALSPITDGKPFAAAAEMAIYGTSSEVPAGHAPQVRPEDDLSDCEQAADPTLRLGASSVAAGGSVDVQLRGFEADSAVQLWLHSEPVLLGEVKVDADGAASATVTIPAATATGVHELVATDANGAELARADLTVTASAGGGGGDGDGDGGGLATTGTSGALWMLVMAVGAGAVLLGLRLRRPRQS